MKPVAGQVLLQNKLKQRIHDNTGPARDCGAFLFTKTNAMKLPSLLPATCTSFRECTSFPGSNRHAYIQRGMWYISNGESIAIRPFAQQYDTA